jgi:uncharacterized protein
MIKDLVYYMAQSLVDNPGAVQVRQIEGKVIGKQGKIAKAMRTLVNIAAARDGKRATLEIQS